MNQRKRVLLDAILDAGHYHWQPGQNCVRRGGTDDWHLISSLKGTGVFGRTAADLQSAPPGTLMLWRPGTPQHYTTAPGARSWERLWLHFQPPADWMDLLAWPEVAPGLMRVTLPPTVRASVQAALRACTAHARSGASDGNRLGMNRLEYALLLVRGMLRAQAPSREPRIEQLLQAIGTNLTAQWSVARLAQVISLSPAQVTRLCARHLGESPHRLVERLRLEEAARLIAAGDARVLQIAHQVGFSDLSHFTRRFRIRFNVTPTAYRSRHLGGVVPVREDGEHLVKHPRTQRTYSR